MDYIVLVYGVNILALFKNKMYRSFVGHPVQLKITQILAYYHFAPFSCIQFKSKYGWPVTKYCQQSRKYFYFMWHIKKRKYPKAKNGNNKLTVHCINKMFCELKIFFECTGYVPTGLPLHKPIHTLLPGLRTRLLIYRKSID